MAAEETLGFLITFREAFEAFLLAGIIAGVLLKTGRRHLLPGVAAGLAVSILLGLAGGGLLYAVARGIPEEELFEASMSFLAAGVVLSVVYWMSKHGSRMAAEARSAASKTGLLGVALLTLFLTGRESLETVLMLAPAITRNPLATLAGAVGGAALAAAIAAAVTLAGVRLNLRLFFRATSALLILVAASLAGYGAHEALEWLEEEAGVEPGILAAEVYSVDLPEGHPLNPESPVGAVLSVILGWDTEMEVGRLLAQALTLALGAAILAARR